MNVLVSPIVRALSTSCRRAAKPGYFLHRLIEKEKQLERKIMATEENKLITAKKLPPEATTRQKVLNTLYMETITSVLASEFGDRLAELQLTIMEVRINRDLTIINVYWTSYDDLNTEEGVRRTEEVTKALIDLTPQIRAELSSVRHMGIIPRIHFVRYVGNSTEQKVNEILTRLRVAGELDDVEPEIPVQDEIPDVYGLDREKILREIQTRSAPADIDLSDRVSFDSDKQESALRKLRLKKLRKKRDFDMSSSKFRGRWEREVFEQNFAPRPN